MSTYPMLNDRPIDQWMVTELKDELLRRNLPVTGLKDDLVKRLFEAIQDKILHGREKTSGGIPEDLKGGEIPGSVDASVNQASIEEHIGEVASEVTGQGAGLGISVTEAYDESILATSEVTQEAVAGTAEASQRSFDAIAEVESSLVDTAATDETNGDVLEPASSGNTRVNEAYPHSEDLGDTIEKTPEDDTNNKMAVDDVPSDFTGGDIKLRLNMHNKILETEDVPAPPDDIIILHGDHEDADAVAAADPEDDTSKKIDIGVVSDVSHTTIKLGVKVDCKTEQEELLALPDAIALHADPKDADVLAAAENKIPKDNFSVDTLMSGNGHGDPKCSNGDTKPFLCRDKDKVSEVKTDLDFQIKCVSIFSDNISTSEKNDVKGNLNADGCDLELEAKQEICKPSSTIPSPGDHLQVLDVNKELHKTGTSLQELGSTSNIDLDREESPDGSSHEKLNLDRSSGDESMDEDVMESRHADSNIKPDDLGGKTVVTSEHVLKEVSLLDNAVESSSAHTNELYKSFLVKLDLFVAFGWIISRPTAMLLTLQWRKLWLRGMLSTTSSGPQTTTTIWSLNLLIHKRLSSNLKPLPHLKCLPVRAQLQHHRQHPSNNTLLTKPYLPILLLVYCPLQHILLLLLCYPLQHLLTSCRLPLALGQQVICFLHLLQGIWNMPGLWMISLRRHRRIQGFTICPCPKRRYQLNLQLATMLRGGIVGFSLLLKLIFWCPVPVTAVLRCNITNVTVIARFSSRT
ncbi:hypothetical protein PVAP13_2NG598100 [Panicum virgatum]|uniref:SAP domain-containing protein n=1 Tax=Panicum virgatum TaxID=38727 RepID=A0A8T0VNS0_PANVG|nr:hypothetical protein PVAP13_2NG598100 [Panicum virgatum]